MLAPYTDLPPAHKILKECEATVLPWAIHWASDVSSGECAHTVLVCPVSAVCSTKSFYLTVVICHFLLLLCHMSGLWWYDKWAGRKWELITVRWKSNFFFGGKCPIALWHDCMFQKAIKLASHCGVLLSMLGLKVCIKVNGVQFNLSN